MEENVKNIVKLTFSLTSLVVLLAVGLVLAPSVMADHGNFDVTITAAENMIDVSSDDGMQIASGRDRADRALTPATATFITLLIKSDRIVNLGGPGGDLMERKTHLDSEDIIIDAYDAEGRALGLLPLAEVDDVVIVSHRDPTNPGREFLIRVDEQELTNAYTAVRAGGAPFEIHTLLFSIPAGAMEQADIDYVTKKRSADGHPMHSNKAVAAYRVDLVDDDEGAAAYNLGVGATAAGSGVPGVVTIDQIRERVGEIEELPFEVKVILTEEPAGGLTTDKIVVKNGKATSVRKGTTLKGASTTPTQTTELTVAMASYTSMDGTAATVLGSLPAATGRDNMFHQYFVNIEPDPSVNGYVTISIDQFSDKVKPVPNMYVPLSDSQIVATTLAAAETTVRNARVANETLMVRVNTAATADIFKPSADARLPHEKFIPEKLVIPANGYLVLASGSYAQSGIRKADAKLADKKDPGEDIYNSVENFNPPYPGDDLANFFQNGGTIQLVYQDIPGNGADADADTGYAGASSATINPGAVIINEIMWGYDRGLDNRAYAEGQWIELHNTTSAAISLDKQEWILAYGSTTSFAAGTVVDKVSNNPASGYWEALGQSGASNPDPLIERKSDDDLSIQVIERQLEDIISMSRVAGSTDGTAKASWAPSTLPTANFTSAGRIGTPGAPNEYDTSAIDAAKAAADKAAADKAAAVSKAPVATASDLMISEIMVASNEGRLPQWIEITSSATGEVSLDGWAVGIDNDPADADVAALSLGIKLDGVTVAEGQTVLVVSKIGRNSGVGMDIGDIREDRIVDASAQVKPASMTYMLLSEVAFRIALEPPLPLAGGVTDRGDVVGNLGGGWELPMSEDGRSSLIRREMDGAAEIMGTDAAGWTLASDTSLIGAYVETYYGDKDDEGTPGYNAGGALPVELSKFSAARDRVTGQVVITWETQSELNNAGFFIKRSQQRNGQFVVVNPTMIAGAGTVSEKQSYTYTDTTAKPNIVYYYQIEDVSLDGNRQTLTRGHRLKGHIGAAGKATTTWGELKSSREQ